MKDVFRMPVPVTIKGRISSITNAFVNGVIPVINPTEEQVDEVLSILGMSRETICCSYCGDKYTEWDHLRPLISDKKPTGYVSEIYNLVPSCGKCNQSKGNQNWKEWMYSNARLSPKSRGIKDIDERAKRLEVFQNSFSKQILMIDFENVVGKDMWKEHWNNYNMIVDMIDKSQRLSNEIRRIIISHTDTERIDNENT